MTTLEVERAIFARLGRVWSPFFQRFGRLTAIQVAAIPIILDGRNVVVAAPTAGGKTEAAMAPLALRRLAGELPGWTVLVSPTRALVNDLHRRLQHPFEQLGLRVERRTGDHPAFDASSPPSFLVTTPESFDSLLCRSPRSFATASSLVVDELHLFDGTARGDQLRVLCERLRRIRTRAAERGDAASSAVQFVALSATLSDPAAAGRRYFDDPVVVTAGAPREIEAESRQWRGPQDLIECFRRRTARPMKVLVFTRSRAEAEKLAAELANEAPYAPNTFVHHGSLSRQQREGVEERFGTASWGICVATSTLELGIDIGDVDLVVLVRPPHSVSSFLQRVGRGCRRRGDITAVLCAWLGDRDRVSFEAIISAARRGEVGGGESGFRPSVILQQLASYTKQRGGAVDRAEFRSLFRTLEGADAVVADQLLDSTPDLIREEFLAFDAAGRLHPGPKMLEIQDGSSLFANFSSDRGGAEIRDRTTGEVLGHAGVSAGAARIAFGGRPQRITSRSDGAVLVEAESGSGRVSSVYFRSRGSPVSRHMADVLRQHLGLTEGTVPRVSEANGRLLYFWFLGGFGARLVGRILAEKGIRGSDSAFCFESSRPLDAEAFRFDESELVQCARRCWGDLVPLLEAGSPTFTSFVPDAATEEWVVQTARHQGLWHWSQSVLIVEAESTLRTTLLELA